MKRVFCLGLFLMCFAHAKRDKIIDSVSPTPYDLIGKKAPEFELPGIQDTSKKLSDFNGKWRVLLLEHDIFHNGVQSKYLQELSGWLKKQNTEIIFISAQSVEDITYFSNLINNVYTFLSDRDRKIANLYFIKMDKPTIIIIDDKGLVKEVLTSSWAEYILVELMLFFIRKSYPDDL
jgi:peroxiredoxin